MLRMKNAQQKGLKDGLAIKSAHCSRRSLEFHSQHRYLLTIVCDSSFKGSDAFFWPPRVLTYTKLNFADPCL